MGEIVNSVVSRWCGHRVGVGGKGEEVRKEMKRRKTVRRRRKVGMPRRRKVGMPRRMKT